MAGLRVSFPSPCGEPWEAMKPTGCHRACAKCDRVFHDLSQYNVADVEKLLRDEPDSCVRANIDTSGVIATKAEGHGISRIVAAVGVSAGLLMSPPVLARNKRADGVIAGTTQPLGFRTTVTAKDKNGNSYQAKVRSNGRYRIKSVPPGIYAVEFSSADCGAWTVENVVVDAGRSIVADEPDNDEICIVVGLVKIVDNEG